MSEQALKGLKVVAFTWLVTGPVIVKFLADHGATVIKIESNTRPELLRLSPPYKDGKVDANGSGYHNFLNVNQYSASLNLTLPEGIAVAKRLTAWADVVVENFRPDVLNRMGLGYEDIKKMNPKVIMLSATMVGQKGPYAHQPGIGAQMVSYAGFTNVTGWKDRGPTQPYGAYTDIPAPPQATSALLAALLRQRKTGEGCYLDISQYETGIVFLAPLALDYMVNGREGGRFGNSCDYACPHGVYPCQGDDRWVAIAIFHDDEWETLRKVMGNPRWAKNQKYSTFLGRKRNEELIDKRIGEWTINFTAEEVMTKLQAAGIDAGVVQNGKDSLEDPHFKARNFLWEMKDNIIGDFHYLGQSFTLSETPAQPIRPSPSLGEHTEYVCCELLGMSNEEFVALMAKGAFD